MDSQVSLNTRRQRSMLQDRGLEGLLCGNYDMSTNVVSRLPSLALLRLKLVSKGLNDLIADRTFARLQTGRTETVCGFFYQEVYLDCGDYASCISYVPGVKVNNHVYNTVLEFLPERVTIQASCNGLICCRSRLSSSETMIYVCNPLRKEWNRVQLPDPNEVCSLALAFDPFKNTSHVTTHFKVVAVRKVEDDIFLFNIYSSETGRWINSEVICQCNHKLIKNKSIFAGGDLYWLTDGDKILMLNPENELTFLVEVPLPGTEFTANRQFCIGESEGRLHYVLLSEHGLQLWLLKDRFASQWDIKYSISLEEFKGYIPEMLFNLAQTLNILFWLDLWAFKDGILFMRVSTSIHSFDFETRKAKLLCDISTLDASVLFPPVVVPYSWSLAPLDEE